VTTIVSERDPFVVALKAKTQKKKADW